MGKDMSLSKIKTIAIAALLLINALFLAVIIIDTAADARSERLSLENAAAVLRNNGITVNSEDVKSAGTLRAMRTERGHEVEEAIAQAVLGSVEIRDMGVIIRYENSMSGFAEFYSAGDFEIQLREGAALNTRGALRTVQDLLSDMSIETSVISQTGLPGSEIVTAVAAFRGVSVFNCIIEFVFSGEGLATITGRYVTVIEVAEDSLAISSPGTALLGVLAAVRSGQIEISRIESVEFGYHYRTIGPSGEGELAPAWLISADSGKYIVDGTTGEVEFVYV